MSQALTAGVNSVKVVLLAGLLGRDLMLLIRTDVSAPPLDAIFSVYAVSYTHLDVYKRQRLYDSLNINI